MGMTALQTFVAAMWGGAFGTIVAIGLALGVRDRLPPAISGAVLALFFTALGLSWLAVHPGTLQAILAGSYPP